MGDEFGDNIRRNSREEGEEEMAFEKGPYLQIAAFCEQVIEDKRGMLSLINVVDRTTHSRGGPQAPEEMPAFDLNWKLVLSLKSGEARGSYPVRIVPELPSAETKEPILLSVHLEGGNRGVNVVADMSMRMEMPGVHWVNVYFDDELLTRLPIEVIYSRFSGPARALPK